MLEWIDQGKPLAEAYERVFRRPGRTFGSAKLHWGGLHDDNNGVQWNVGYNPDGPTCWIGVNLEGMAYDGWPIARLIARELKRPTLLTFVAARPKLAAIRLIMERDYWNPRDRVSIEESEIANTALKDLTDEVWRAVLRESRNCLGASTGGRGKQIVTPRSGSGSVLGEVTPHLTFRLSVPSVDSWEQFIRKGLDLLDPLYEWTEERVAR